MEQTAHGDETIELNMAEQEAYLRFLIAKLRKTHNRHEALTAKAYRSILSCLQADARAQLPAE